MDSVGMVRPSIAEAAEALEAAEGGFRKSMVTGGILVFLAAALLFFSAAALHAQVQPFEEEERRVALEKQRSDQYRGETWQNIYFDWGGWVRSSYFDFEEDPDALGVEANERHLRDVDFRLWTQLGYKDIHDVYVRMRAEYLDWSDGDQPTDTPEDSWERPDLDQAFYTLHIDSLACPGTETGARSWHLATTVGRQFIYLGTGMTYQQVNDGVVLNGNWRDFEFMGFAARTQFPQRNIDRSPQVAENMDRHFYGGQVSYRIGNHTPYAFGLVQRDHSPERPEVLQEFDYDSEYFGVGVRGAILPTVGYFAEWVKEWGESFADIGAGVTNNREDIDADAANAGVRWLPDCWSHPRFEFQWTYGSGDDDRSRPSDTTGGNLAGTDDTAFNAFGFVLTGYSVAPRVTNIHVFRLGAAFHPLEKTRAFKDFELGANYFYFTKSNDDGGISDFRATDGDDDIGHEADFYLNWRPLSDLTAQVRYGKFFAGKAYPDEDADRDFLLLSFTIMY